MIFLSRPRLSRGLSILESLVVLCTSLLLIVILVPVVLVQMGLYKLPEPEITPKPIIIDGREVLSKTLQTPAPPPASQPAAQAAATPPPPAKPPESPKAPVTPQADKAPPPPPSPASSASTKP